ncbi:MAG: Holliday junction resolvase RuvX [Woeseiaceae bacterium]|jgi:putative holliday junction resolvase|nr:Holliday junction resolvase RuvX [Woeseiaceae bacterium]
MKDIILALDFGLRRIGCAIGQNITGTANPIGMLSNSNNGPDWIMLEKYIDEWKPSILVVGLPLHEDGTPSLICNDIRKFISKLEKFNIPIETIDEQYTSIEAKEILKKERQLGLRGKIKKETIDATAATLIAKRWLNKNS